MTPLHIEIMLHYSYTDTPFKNWQAPAQREYIKNLCESRMLKGALLQYTITDKGRAYVERLLAIPIEEPADISLSLAKLGA